MNRARSIATWLASRAPALRAGSIASCVACAVLAAGATTNTSAATPRARAATLRTCAATPHASAATLSASAVLERAQDPVPVPPPTEKPTEKPADKPESQGGEKPAPKPDTTNPPKPVETPPKPDAPKPDATPPQDPAVKPENKPTGTPEKTGEKPSEAPGDKPADKPAEKPAEKPADKPGETPVAHPDDPKTPVEPAANPNVAPMAPASASAGAPPARAFDYAAHATQATFEAEVRRLVTAHANRLRVTSLGKSRNARDLWLLTASDLAAGDPDKKPALFVATGLDPSFEGRPAGPEAALYALRALLESADRDPAVAGWLARTTVYVVPAPDPDQTFAAETVGARACRLDRNFPSDWKPWSSESCAQGPYPLSEPETQSLARFLAARPNVGAALLFSRGLQLVTETALDATDELERILCGRIVAEEAAARAGDTGRAEPHALELPKTAGDALARRSEAFARESGSLAAFCRARLSAFVVALDPNVGGLVDLPHGRAPAGFVRAAAAIERLARELPRLECTVVKSERLRERLWLVDLDIENQGLLPTLSVSERASCPGSVWFEASGGRITQVGIARSGAVETNAAPKQPGVWLVGHLDGREKARLHVLVEAAEGTTLELLFRTLRDGETKCAVTLH